MSSASQQYAAQQKNLRTKAGAKPGQQQDNSKLEHFERFDVGAKTTFGLLGEMAGKLMNSHRPQDGGKLSKEDYVAVATELFEELCAQIDMPPNVVGLCINATDKAVIDSRPKKLKGGQLKVDGAGSADLDKDTMGDEDEPKASNAAGSSGGKRPALNRANTAGLGDDAEDGDGAGGSDEVLTADDLERLKEAERKKAEAEEKERQAQRAALEAEEHKRLLQEENERRLKEQARKASNEVPIGMTVLKKDDDDDALFGGMAAKGGKKGGKGGRR